MDAPRRISPAGLELLKAFEKFSLDVYADQAGNPTIYWGHLIRPGERFDHTPEQGDLILAQDLDVPEACIRAWCGKTILQQREFDALVCFAFNAGVHALQGSTLLKLVKAGNLPAAAEEFPKWDKVHKAGRIAESEGLRKRREAERALFLGKPWSPP